MMSSLRDRLLLETPCKSEMLLVPGSETFRSCTAAALVAVQAVNVPFTFYMDITCDGVKVSIAV